MASHLFALPSGRHPVSPVWRRGAVRHDGRVSNSRMVVQQEATGTAAGRRILATISGRLGLLMLAVALPLLVGALVIAALAWHDGTLAREERLPARAQARFPDRPITLVVPFGPGGIADLTARTVAQAMSVTLKVPIIIDNKPSAGSIVGSTAVAQAAPDGHTLLLMSNANALSASLFRKLRDFG